MSTIEFTHGSVTTQGRGSMDIWVNYRRVSNERERMIHEAVKDPGSGVREDGGLLEVTNSSTFQNGKIWTKRRCTFPDGSYLKFTIKRTGGGRGGVFDQSLHNIMISPRETAPLVELKIEPPFQAGKSTLSMIYIIGRFDVLPPKEVKRRKLHINSQGANEEHTFDLAPMDEFLQFRVIEKGVRPPIKPKVIKTGKSGKGIVRIRRGRRINLS